jgi:hypothetical protein
MPQLTRKERRERVAQEVFKLMQTEYPMIEASDRLALCDQLALRLRHRGAHLGFSVDRRDVALAIRWLVAKEKARAGHIYRFSDGERVYRVNLLRF